MPNFFSTSADFRGVLENLRRIGRVLHISPSRKAVVKAEKVPKIGGPVVDEKKRSIGNVFDVIGPTVSPYVEVEVKVDDPQEVVGSVLYVSSSSKRRKRSRRR
jgi:rRNA processing protein Gar1